MEPGRCGKVKILYFGSRSVLRYLNPMGLFVCCFPSGSKRLLKDTAVGEGNGNPLQYSCLENPMDGEAWWAAVHEVTKS